MNGGQLLAQGADASRLIGAVLEHQPYFFFSEGSDDGIRSRALDQVAAQTVISAEGSSPLVLRFSTCSLPETFAGHCWFDPLSMPWCSLHSYHMHCIAHSVAKQGQMRAVLNIVQALGCNLSLSR